MENNKVPKQAVSAQGISRRNFLKGAGIVAATAAMATVSNAEEIQAATHNSIDEMYEVSSSYERFSQKNEMFCRMEWDEKFIPNPAPQVTNDTPGFSVLDMAAGLAAWTLVNAAPNTQGWRVGNEGHFSWFPLGVARIPAKRWEPTNEEEATRVIRLFAKQALPNHTYTGITLLDPRWVYTEWYHRGTKESGRIVLSDKHTSPEIGLDGTRYIPTSMKYVIVLAQSMPYEAGLSSPYGVGGIGAGVGYSSGVHHAATIAEFIRGLGYQAIPSVGCTALNVPLAIAAGMGEQGRSGLLISPYGGARVRTVKVITDLPLVLDKPISFGVNEFCKTCKRCAEACPTQSISYDDPTTNGPNLSNANGVKKWYVNGESCRLLWNHHAGIPCMRCVSVCPYNKPDGYWTHDLGMALAGVPGVNSLMETVDSWMGYGKLRETEDFWKLDPDKAHGISK